jgi:hypothetical protein
MSEMRLNISHNFNNKLECFSKTDNSPWLNNTERPVLTNPQAFSS